MKKFFSGLMITAMLFSQLANIPLASAVPGYVMGDVLINEFFTSPSTGNEWYELFNTTGGDINLTGWTLSRGPGEADVLDLSLIGTALPSKGILVFPMSSVPANDAGDVIKVKYGATLIWGVSYGTQDPGMGVAHSAAPGVNQSGYISSTPPDPLVYSVSSTPSKGWFNDAVAWTHEQLEGTGSPAHPPTLSSIAADLSAGNNVVTNMASLAEVPNPSAATSLYFEKRTTVGDPATALGRLNFDGPINLTDQKAVDYLKTMGNQMDMSGGTAAYAKVGMNTFIYGTTDESIFKNKLTTVTMYGLTGLAETPDLVVTDNAGVEIPPAIAGLPNPAYPAITNENFVPATGVFTFDTSHLTSFAGSDRTPPTVGPVFVDETDLFYAGTPNRVNTDITIMATATDANGISDNCEYSMDAGSTWNPAVWDGVTGYCSKNIDPGIATDTSYTFLMRARDNNGNTGTTSASLTAVGDIVKPTAVITAPGDTASIVGPNVDFEYTPTDFGGGDEGSGLNTCSLWWNYPAGGALTKKSDDTTPSDAVTNTFAETGMSTLGTYTWDVFCTDNVGSGAWANGPAHNSFTLMADPDIALLQGDMAALVDGSIKGANPDLAHITVKLDSTPATGILPATGSNGSTIEWSSSNPSIVSDDGQTVVRPAYADGNASVTMTATFTKGAQTDTKDFILNVLKTAPSTIATVTSIAYTVSVGASPQAITNVPYGTSRATFLSNIIHGDSYQTIDSTATNNPIVNGDFIVVTAQDGLTFITYMITVNAVSSIAAVTSTAYTVSAGGTASETITNVPNATSKAAFLAALTKGEANQTWNSAAIADPVVSGNTLVVRAQDETTIVTYTITVLLPVPTFANNYRITSVGGLANYDAAADSTNNLHVVYESAGNIYYQKNIESAELVGAGTSPALAVDSSGNIHVIYSNAGLQYKKRTAGVWGTERAVPGGTVFYSISTDSTGAAHIAADDGGTGGRGHIVYVKDEAGTWSAPIWEVAGWYDSGSGAYYHFPVIRIDSGDKYHLAYEGDGWGGNANDSSRSINIASNSVYGDKGVGGFNWNAGVGLTKNSLSLNGAQAYIAYTNGGTQNVALVNASWTVQSSVAGSGGTSSYNSGIAGSSFMDGVAKYLEFSGSDKSSVATVDAAGTNPIVALGDRSIFYLKGGDIYLKTNQTLEDVTPPAIVSVDSDGATLNAASANPTRITVVFNEDISYPPTIYVNGDDPTVEQGPGLRTFYFDYALPASTNLTTETITVSNAQDAAGNPMVTDSSHSFDVDTRNPDKPRVNHIDFDYADTSYGQNATPDVSIDQLTVGDTLKIFDDGSEIVSQPVTNTLLLVTLPALAEGNHPITVVTTDPSGNQSPVSNTKNYFYDNTDPTTSVITSPAAASYLKGTVTIDANVADNIGGSGINRVEFYYYSLGTKIGDGANTAPGVYSIDWNTLQAGAIVPEGSHNLVAMVYDNAGNYYSSANIAVTVDNTAPINQNTVFTANSLQVGGATVNVISAGEAGGNIWFAPSGTTSFIADGNTITSASGTATTIVAPLTAGTYKLFISDAAGNFSAASTATLTIDNSVPAFSSVTPVNGGYIRNVTTSSAVGYSINKTLGNGTITITRTGGSLDAGSPHPCNLVGTGLTTGAHVINLSDTTNGCSTAVSLTEGAVYSFAFVGMDLLGNPTTTPPSWPTVTNVTFDATSPTVTKLGDGSADYSLPAMGPGYGADLVFNEELSTAGKTAVEDALTAGTTTTLGLSWTGAPNTLAIRANNPTTWENDVTAVVSDLAGNESVDLLLIDSAITATQTDPTTGAATLGLGVTQVVINDSQPTTVTVVAGVTNGTINVDPLVDGGIGVLPEITVNAATSVGNVDIQIPADTTVTGPAGWTGIINVPQIKANTTVTPPVVAGMTATVSEVIEIGFDDTALTFDNAVRIKIAGQGGKLVGYSRAGVFTPITTVCTADTQIAGNALPEGAECKIDVGPGGADLVIWTKHFTKFATYSQAASGGGGSSGSGGGGGSSGGGSSSGYTGYVAPTTPGSTQQTTQQTTQENGTQFDSSFTDIAGHWAQKYIETAKSLNYIGGYADGSFRPDQPINRAEVAKIVALWKNKDIESTTCAKAVFSDVFCAAWYAKSINYLALEKITGGYEDGTFKPSNEITRAEALKMVLYAKGLQNTDVTGYVNPFSDVISTDWYLKIVLIANKLGIAKGYEDGTFGPNKSITRAEFTKIFVETLIK